MKVVRRILLVVGAAAFVTAILRLRGRGGAPPSGNGWRELDLTDVA